MFRSARRITLLLSLFALVAGRVGSEAAPTLELEEVQQMIADRDHQWTAGPTSVSASDWGSFRAILSLRVPVDYRDLPRVDFSRISDKTDDLPSRWDWRDHEGTTPIKNQRSCGSCWAFASVAALEGCARIQDDLIYDLSEQQLISCNWHGYGCNGGFFDGCFDVFHQFGAVAEECMPYLAVDGIPCSSETCEVQVIASEMILIENSVRSIQAAVYEHGPIVCAMCVTSDFRYYTGGCYENPWNGPLNHAVTIVGWDDDLCGGVWICKNSWGTGWGEDGWFMIRYGSSAIGEAATVFVPVPGRVVTVDTVPHETTTDGTAPLAITANLRSRSGSMIDPQTARLHFRVNGGVWESSPLEQLDQDGIWVGSIPPQRMPSCVEYFIEVQDLEGRLARSPWTAPETCFSFDIARVWEKFERDDSEWRVGDRGDDAVTGAWECVDPIGTQAQPDGDHSLFGTRCWVTGQHREAEDTGYSDVDGGTTTLLSPAYDLSFSETAIVKYWRWFSNDRGASPNEDPWVVQVRNEGSAWVDLENTTESSNEWILIQKDLGELFGRDLGVVEFRFVACDRDLASCVEAAVDDFTILADEREPVSVQRRNRCPIKLDAILPNPLTAGSELRFSIPEENIVQCEIFAVDGRVLREIRLGRISAGTHQLLWDGRDQNGRKVPPGIYFFRLQADGARVARSVTVIR